MQDRRKDGSSASIQPLSETTQAMGMVECMEQQTGTEKTQSLCFIHYKQWVCQSIQLPDASHCYDGSKSFIGFG